MQALIERRNRDLLQNLDQLHELLVSAEIPPELELFRQRLLVRCEELRQLVLHNLSYLSLKQQHILKDILSSTTQVVQDIHLISTRLVTPILRAKPTDRLCLITISWLHRSHVETVPYPAAFVNSSPAIWPFHDIAHAPIYFFPNLEERGLLYQPLLFHEFGHFLYRCHEPEMNALVRELQYSINDLLMPASQRNDRYSEDITAQRQEIAYTWYAWVQELFCDSVGFQIGGPSFINAFSAYLGMSHQNNYYRLPEDMRRSSHPVTWLRVHFLARRATNAGFRSLAKLIEQEWLSVASLLGVMEDYYGFYDESLDDVITKTIEDMLIEAQPRQFNDDEVGKKGWSPESDSLVRLFNWAWQVYTEEPGQYPIWESNQVDRLLSSSSSFQLNQPNNRKVFQQPERQEK